MSESKIERAANIKSRMAEHQLTSQWLMLRLSKDFGIEVDKTSLSMILSGARRSGDKPEQVLAASEQILDKYIKIFAEEGA